MRERMKGEIGLELFMRQIKYASAARVRELLEDEGEYLPDVIRTFKGFRDEYCRQHGDHCFEHVNIEMYHGALAHWAAYVTKILRYDEHGPTSLVRKYDRLSYYISGASTFGGRRGGIEIFSTSPPE